MLRAELIGRQYAAVRTIVLVNGWLSTRYLVTVATRLALTFAEVLVLAFTLRGTLGAYRRAKEVGIATTIAPLLIRDGKGLPMLPVSPSVDA